MNLYTFSYWKGKERGFFQVQAETEERARELLSNDGHNPVCFDCETVFALALGYTESIAFSIVFDQED